MEVVIDIFIRVVITYLFSYPGAAVRKIFIRKRKHFKEILAEDIFVNSAIGLLILVPPIGGVTILLKQ